MSTDIARFDFKGQSVRAIVGDDGNPWIVATDVARILGYRDARDITRMLDDDEKGTQLVRTLGGAQQALVINEPGLYQAVMKSRVTLAKEFRRWAAHEVFPSIRRHGAYVTPSTTEEWLNDPDRMIEALTALKLEREQRLALESKVSRDAPKVLFADCVSASDDCILVRQLANIMKQNGLETGEKRLYDRLRADGYLCKTGASFNRPTQRSMELGLFVVKESTRTRSDGTVKIDLVTMVTGKGQQYFVHRYCNQLAVSA